MFLGYAYVQNIFKVVQRGIQDMFMYRIYLRLYREVSRMTMFIFGMGAKFLLSGINTTLVHGAQNLQVCFHFITFLDYFSFSFNYLF